MTWEDFKRRAEFLGLRARLLDNGRHWRVEGALYRVNYYPSKGTVFLDGMTKGCNGSADEAIHCAMYGPVFTTKPGDRKDWHAAEKSNKATAHKVWQNKTRLLHNDPHCHWCRKRLGKKTATLDHVIPLSKGGTNQGSNLVLACYECNQARGNRIGAPQPKSEHAEACPFE